MLYSPHPLATLHVSLPHIQMGIASDMKQNPDKYKDSLSQKTLLMLFEKPSLRTRVSFETGMTQLGGHAIFYSIADSPLGKKESLSDTGKVLSRYADFIMARVNKRQDIQELAEVSSIPVINALDNYAHPCQMLADLQTIIEQKSSAEGLKLAFFGDVANNVTYDLMRLGSIVGMKVAVCGPVDKGSEYAVEESVIEECKALGGDVIITTSVEEAATGADIVYCDSWMSYGIPDSEGGGGGRCHFHVLLLLVRGAKRRRKSIVPMLRSFGGKRRREGEETEKDDASDKRGNRG